MEFRQLRYFVAVAEERSFTRAAARLHLSQQSLSTAISRLEAQVGCLLLDRTSKPLAPTPAGRALLDAAPAVFAAMDAATTAMYEAGDGLRGELRLRYGTDSEALAEPLLNGFQRRHPGVELRAWAGMDGDNVAALRAGSLDAILAWVSVPDDLAACVVGHEHALIAMPDRHPLSPRAAVPVAALAREPLVMFPRHGAPAVWDFLVARLRPGDRRAAGEVVEIPVGGQGTMAEHVLDGRGLCPISASLATSVSRPGLVLRPLDPPVHVPLLLAWREPAPTLVRALAADLTEHSAPPGREPPSPRSG